MRRLLVSFLWLCAVCAAADVSGTWDFKVETNAASGTPVFVLKQDGERLSGTYSGALGGANITGTVKGDTLTIEFTASGYKVIYTGKLEGDRKVSGKVEIADGEASGTFTGTRR